MSNFPFIDLHEDLQSHLDHLDLFLHGKQTDFSLLEQAGAKLVVATAFPLPPRDDFFDPATDALIEREFEAYRHHVQTDPRWRLVRDAEDLRAVLAAPDARGLLLHVEGLNVMDERNFEKLERWHAMGWRSLGPVWNLSNPLGGGTNDPARGLTPLGARVIDWLAQKRMVLDFAHMNRPTFWDAAGRWRGPIYASHAGAAALRPSPRNLDDAQLRAAGESGGAVGIFFANRFLAPEGARGGVGLVADHLLHVVRVAGAEAAALGTDLGGVLSGLVDGLPSVDRVAALWDELAGRGCADDLIEKIAWRNAARALEEMLAIPSP